MRCTPAGHNDEVQLIDTLVEGDDDLRKLPLHLRKTNLERLLARRQEGIFVNPFQRGEIGPDLFRAACDLGLEGWCQYSVLPLTALQNFPHSE